MGGGLKHELDLLLILVCGDGIKPVLILRLCNKKWRFKGITKQ